MKFHQTIGVNLADLHLTTFLAVSCLTTYVYQWNSLCFFLLDYCQCNCLTVWLHPLYTHILTSMCILERAMGVEPIVEYLPKKRCSSCSVRFCLTKCNTPSSFLLAGYLNILQDRVTKSAETLNIAIRPLPRSIGLNIAQVVNHHVSRVCMETAELAVLYFPHRWPGSC